MENVKGNVFDIQRYSIHDGYGIRTVLFLKGCPLRCKWCANPESWTSDPQLFYTQTKCIGCNTCVKKCLNGEAEPKKEGSIRINWDKCRKEQLDWVAQCPTGALSIKGNYMTTEQAFEEVVRDQAFFEESGGGVTVSGGEPFAQSDFLLSFLKHCKKNGIHTAVETTGYVKYEVLREIAEYTDCFLYDIKTMDSEIHKKWTGVGNEKILSNLQRISKMNKDIIVRTPLIPGVNDKIEDIKNIMKFLKECRIDNYNILPFHQYGSKKYSSIGVEYPLGTLEAPEKTYVEQLQKIIEEEGFLREFKQNYELD